MYSDKSSSDECTAAPGVMGWKSCHNYPGCGCGSDSYSETNEVKLTPLESVVFYTPPSNWKLLPANKVEKSSGGIYTLHMDWGKLVAKFPISAKVVEDGLLIHKDVLNKHGNIRSIFEIQED